MKFFRLKLSLPIILIAAIILLIFLHQVKILSPLEHLIVKIFSPVQARVYSLAINISDKLFSDDIVYEKLVEENKNLHQQVETLTVENVNLKLLERENNDLLEQLKMVKSFEQEYISCRVLSKEKNIGSNILVLNCGSKQGIIKGLAAIIEPGIIAGKIIEVDSATSRLLLVSSKNSKIGATVLNQEMISGIVSGLEDSTLMMELIPTQAKISQGNIIVTSQLEDNIPQGLVIGEVDKIQLSANSFFQSAVIQPITNYDSIKIVTVLLPPNL